MLSRSPAISLDRFLEGMVPTRGIGSRINIRMGQANRTGSGLLYALRQHGGNGPAGKSQFSIQPAEIVALLRRPDVIRTPIRASSGSPHFVREVDVGLVIGRLPLNRGGRPTRIITVLTDRLGNLANVFPGRLARKATFEEETGGASAGENGPRQSLFWQSLSSTVKLLNRSRRHLASQRMLQARAVLILARRRLVLSGKLVTPAILRTHAHSWLAHALLAVDRAGGHLVQNRPLQAAQELQRAAGMLQKAMQLAMQAPAEAKA